MTIRYHKPAAYNLPTNPQKDEFHDYRISLKGKTGVKGGGEKERGSLRANITPILKYMTAEEKAEKYGKAEMVSELKYLIVGVMSVNDVPSLPPSKNMKSATGKTESMKSAKVDYTETLASGAAAAAKLMERTTAMYLK